MRRGEAVKNSVQLSARESGLLFPKSCFHALAGQDKRHKYRFARTAIVGGKARQPVSAIDQFLDVESQASILQGQRGESSTLGSTSPEW